MPISFLLIVRVVVGSVVIVSVVALSVISPTSASRESTPEISTIIRIVSGIIVGRHCARAREEWSRITRIHVHGHPIFGMVHGYAGRWKHGGLLGKHCRRNVRNGRRF